MKKQIRCPADKTLLVTVTTDARGQVSREIARDDINFKYEPTATAGVFQLVAFCPKCMARAIVGLEVKR